MEFAHCDKFSLNAKTRIRKERQITLRLCALAYRTPWLPAGRGRLAFNYYQIAFTIFLSIGLSAQESDKNNITSNFSLEVTSDYRLFFEEGLYENQNQQFASIAFKPEFSISWDEGEQSVLGDLFGRLSSSNDKRSHLDIRELYYQVTKSNWELSIGLKKVYWGVIESVHLVDVINQTDLVESFDGEDKLGQPMVQYTLLANFGTIEAFFLPYHRYRTLSGEAGRFRFPIVIDDSTAEYESGNEEFDLGWAFRYSHYFGVFDIGLSYIYHTNREFLIRPNANSELIPFYEKMYQLGLDLQATTGSMLWKFEGISRFTDSDTFQALAMGGEYTFGNINGKGLDLGLLAEFIYDNRTPIDFDLSTFTVEGSSGTGFQKDLFVGGRFAFNDINDTSILFGGLFDLEHSGKILSIEGQKRFFENWKGELEFRLLTSFAEEELFYFFRNDSFMQLTVSRFF